eukprot:scaffold5393_cov35-Prasinocladus_malaysianus.AAC.4
MEVWIQCLACLWEIAVDMSLHDATNKREPWILDARNLRTTGTSTGTQVFRKEIIRENASSFPVRAPVRTATYRHGTNAQLRTGTELNYVYS